MTPRTRISLAIGTGILAAAFYGCDKTDPTAPSDGTVVLSADPTTVRPNQTGDGTSDITATVLDAEGRPVSNASVHFSTTDGDLRSNHRPVRTNSEGIASDVLTININQEDATVTGRSGSKSGTVTVSIHENARPVAKPLVSPTTARIGQAVTFDGSTSTDADGDQTINNWKWTLTSSLTNGTIETDIVEGDADSTAQSFPKPFASTRSVTVQLQVTDNQGQASTIATFAGGLLIVANLPPTAVVAPPILSTRAGQVFTLSGANSRDDPREVTGRIVRYDWNMGDGSAPIENNTSPTQAYSYAMAGSYTATLTVYDNGDLTGCDPVTHLCNNYEARTATSTITVAP